MATRAVITEDTPTVLADLVARLGSVDALPFVTELAKISATLELDQSAEGPLYNRIGAIMLATAWIEAGVHPAGGQAEPLRLDELFRMANGLPLRDTSIQLTGSALTEHNCRVVSRSVAQQSTYIDAIGPSIGRTEILLRQALPAALKGRANPLNELTGILGMSYSEARALSIGLYTWLLSSPETPVVDASVFAEALDPGRFASWTNAWARTRNELHAIRLASKAYGYTDALDFRFTYSVLRDHPLVQFDEGIVVPIPRHLALRFGDGVSDFLRMHFDVAGKTAAFDQAFGDATEEYVRLRLERELGAGAYVPLPVLSDELSPDGLIRDGECVLELKSKRLPRGMITTGQLFAAKQFLGKKGLGKGVAQLLAEVQRTRAGRGRGLNAQRLDDVSLCLVTPEGLPGFHLEPIRRWVISAFRDVIEAEFTHLTAELQSLERFEWLSFDEFDAVVLASKFSGTPIGRLLRRFRLEAADGWGRLESRELSPPLPLWLHQRDGSIPADSWLTDTYLAVAAECATLLFGTKS